MSGSFNNWATKIPLNRRCVRSRRCPSDCGSRSPLDPQPEQLCGHRGSARGRAPVQVLRGRPLDAGPQRGERPLVIPRWQNTGTSDDNLPPRQAVTTSKTGVVNNTIQVKRTDFEVFDALRIDSENTADVSGWVGFQTAWLREAGTRRVSLMFPQTCRARLRAPTSRTPTCSGLKTS